MNTIDHALRPLTLGKLVKLGHRPRPTRLALEMLDQMEGGALALELPDNLHLRAGHGPLVAHLRVRDHAVFNEALGRGDIGFAEAYMDGAWDTEDLPALLTLLSRNRKQLQSAIYGRFFRLLGHRLGHLLRANTRAGSRRNIEAHFDLGNDFYQCWLDPTMTYSDAVFADADEPLEQAQLRKYRRILTQLDARPGQLILEVGCGWGGFAEVAATEIGCRVLGLTLSPAQLEFARARAERGGYADKVSFELCDYRDVAGQYDHIVSIEMIEAVAAYTDDSLYVLVTWKDTVYNASNSNWLYDGPSDPNKAGSTTGWTSQRADDNFLIAFDMGAGKRDVWNWSLALSEPMGFAIDMVDNGAGAINDAGTLMYVRNALTDNRGGPQYEWNDTEQALVRKPAGQSILDPGYYLLNKKTFTGDIAAGEVYYQAECAPCHGPTGNGEGTPAGYETGIRVNIPGQFMSKWSRQALDDFAPSPDHEGAVTIFVN